MGCCTLSYWGIFQLDYTVSSAKLFKDHSLMQRIETFRKHCTPLFFVYVKNCIVLISDYGLSTFSKSLVLSLKLWVFFKKTILLVLSINIWTIFDNQKRDSSVLKKQNQKNPLFSLFLYELFLLNYFWMIQSLKELRV